MNLYPRYVQHLITEALSDTPVVSILGPRQVGKSTLAKVVAPNRQYITLDDENLLTLAQEDDIGFISSLPEYVIIDEIQRAPNLMLAIKKAVDENRKPGRFLLTGSANLALMKQTQDSLAGRHEPIHLLPLTNHEIAQTAPEKSFVEALIKGNLQPQSNAYHNTLSKLKEAVCQGGYPEPLLRSEKRAQKWFNLYIEDIITRDVKSIDEIRNPQALLTLLKLSCNRTATLLEINTLATELQISAATVKNYLATLEKLFLIRAIPAWAANPAKRLIKSPKMHLIDTGMACAVCGLTTDDWLHQPQLFGQLIESYAVQQIISQLSWLDEGIDYFHYRDQKKREVDLVLEKGNAVWGIEMKRATTISNNDFKGLKVLAETSGPRWQGGAILYGGDHILPTPVEKTFAVPYSALWDGY